MQGRFKLVAFDLDPASLAGLRQALPGWEVEELTGATPASLARRWDPAAADFPSSRSSGRGPTRSGCAGS